MQDLPEQPNQQAAHRRNPTLKMATLAFQNLMQAKNEDPRSSRKDLVSELMLPLSSILLIIAILMPESPALKAACFLLPIAALGYYFYRRFGVIATFDQRQAYIMWRLLGAMFIMGGTFAMFCVYGLAYVMSLARH